MPKKSDPRGTRKLKTKKRAPRRRACEEPDAKKKCGPEVHEPAPFELILRAVRAGVTTRSFPHECILELEATCRSIRAIATGVGIVKVCKAQPDDKSHAQQRMGNGWFPLGAAAFDRETGYLERLLAKPEYRATVNLGNYAGWTPLLAAVIYGNRRTVELLLDAGANPNLASAFYSGGSEHGDVAPHETPLEAALKRIEYQKRPVWETPEDRLAVIELLRARGAKCWED